MGEGTKRLMFSVMLCARVSKGGFDGYSRFDFCPSEN